MKWGAGNSHWFWLACMFGLFTGCANQDRLVVYADPWLGEYAQEMVAEFQMTHPATDIQLKLLSSELIVQHIRFGQPVDVFLCFGSEFYTQPDFRDKVSGEATLATSQVVLLEQRNLAYAAKCKALGTEHCRMVEASDRPMRRYADSFQQAAESLASCTIIANFQGQARDYMLRGWVPQGFMPAHFANSHPAEFLELARGPLIPNAFTSILLQNAPHSGLAKDFFALTTAEISSGILAKLKYFP